MAARAAQDWRDASWKAATGRLQVVRVTPPDGMCAPCWQNLGVYGLKTWRAAPLAVLRTDLAVTDEQGRVALAKELIALADLAAAHPEEFRQALESEEILKALSRL